jgi:hypothetical protein
MFYEVLISPYKRVWQEMVSGFFYVFVLIFAAHRLVELVLGRPGEN